MKLIEMEMSLMQNYDKYWKNRDNNNESFAIKMNVYNNVMYMQYGWYLVVKNVNAKFSLDREDYRHNLNDVGR